MVNVAHPRLKMRLEAAIGESERLHIMAGSSEECGLLIRVWMAEVVHL